MVTSPTQKQSILKDKNEMQNDLISRLEGLKRKHNRVFIRKNINQIKRKSKANQEKK